MTCLLRKSYLSCSFWKWLLNHRHYFSCPLSFLINEDARDTSKDFLLVKSEKKKSHTTLIRFYIFPIYIDLYYNSLGRNISMMHRLTSTGYVCVEKPKEKNPKYLIQSHRMHGSLERIFVCFPPFRNHWNWIVGRLFREQFIIPFFVWYHDIN